jgi:hypothetical protein
MQALASDISGEVKDTVVGVQSKDALIKRLEALA